MVQTKKLIPLLSLCLLLHAARVHMYVYTHCVNAAILVTHQTPIAVSFQLMAGNSIITIKCLICTDTKKITEMSSLSKVLVTYINHRNYKFYVL
jgi:hypothetical protein